MGGRKSLPSNRRRRLAFRLAVAVAVAVAACLLLVAIPSGTAAAAGPTASPDCAAATGQAAAANDVDLPNRPDCDVGTTVVQERYEAAIAGAGLLAFTVAVFVYRRRRKGRVSKPRVPPASAR